MKRHALVLLVVFAALLSAAPAIYALSATLPAGQSLISKSGPCFTENKGQWNNRVLFKAEGAGGLTWWIERDGFTLLYSQQIKQIERMSSDPLDPLSASSVESAVNLRSHALKFEFVAPASLPVFSTLTPGTEAGATAHEVISSDRLSHNNNYFLGNDHSKWAPNCGNFGRVTLHDVWEGIDVEWWVDSQQIKRIEQMDDEQSASSAESAVNLVEFDFVVHPGADPRQIGFRIDGLSGEMEVTDDGGELLLPTSIGLLRMALPEAFVVDANSPARRAGDQTTDLEEREMEARFVPVGDNCLGIALPEGYGSRKKLVVDPLVYSTYLGGNSEDYGYAIATDGGSGAVVAGITQSNDFPITAGAFQKEYEDSIYWSPSDAFVTRISPDGSELIYSTYLGGYLQDGIYGIATDSSNGVIIAGTTLSSDFPITHGALQETYDGEGDAFIARLNEDGSELIYSTYLGGSSIDYGRAITSDGDGGAVVAGYTWSTDFPVTDGAFQVNYGGAGTATGFVSRLNEDGSALIFSTYLGGHGPDGAFAVTLGNDGDVIVAGFANDSRGFPITDGAFQERPGGSDDGFVTCLNRDGTELVYSTYLGGNDGDEIHAIASDGYGGVIVAGYTYSDNFPTTEGAFQTNLAGGHYDAFAARLSADGSELLYGTYLGGDGDEEILSVSAMGYGGIVATGWTTSDDFPITDVTLQPNNAGGQDAFIARLNASGSELVYSTYFGGGSDDYPYSIKLDGDGGAVVVGLTYSDDFPVSEEGYDDSLHGHGDAFVARINHLEFLTGLEVPDTIFLKETYSAAFDIRGESSNDSADLTILYHSENLPDSVRFEDHGRGDGSFVWQTVVGDSGEYIAGFTVSDGYEELSAETHIIVNSFPLFISDSPDSVLGSEGDMIEFVVTGGSRTPQAHLKVAFQRNNLPRAAIFEDYGDGSGTFSWQTTYDDAGEYIAHFTLSDGTDSLTADVRIIVNDVNGVSEPIADIPDHCYLSANYPNPFNAQTHINFGLPVKGEVTINICDLTGRRVGALVSGRHLAGRHEAVWDAKTLPTGLYIIRMTAPGFEKAQRMILIK